MFILLLISAQSKVQEAKIRPKKFGSWLKLSPRTSSERLLNALEQHNKKAFDYVSTIPKERYARAFFPVARHNQLSSNCVESINGAFQFIRRLPILDMTQEIWNWMMNKRLANSERACSTSIVNNIEAWRLSLHDEIGLFAVHPSSRIEFLVTSFTGTQVIVHLDQRSCSCGLFAEAGFPCKHALAVIQHQRLLVQQYCHLAYTTDTYRRAYSVPIPSAAITTSAVSQDECKVPPSIRHRGRPRTRRGQAGVYRQTARERRIRI